MRAMLAILLVLTAALPARGQEVMPLVRADRWAEAELAAQPYVDPVVRKLVTWYRLLAPGGAGAPEIASFMADSPDWPLQYLLARRRDEALATERDDTVVLAQCAAAAPSLPAALLRCADADDRAGRGADGILLRRRAWVAGPSDPAWEAGFPQGPLTDADQWRRFDRLAWSDTAGATRQIARLGAADRAVALARLAFRRDDPQAAALLAAVPAGRRADPGLMLEQARSLRRANDDAGALALWTTAGAQAEAAATADALPGFWVERSRLARRRLEANDAAGAYAVAVDPAQTGGEERTDSAFLAGFIALRWLHDPTAAAAHFQALADMSKAAITQGRAHYWLGRAAEARNDAAAARTQYTAAAAWTETFYGQLAAQKLGDGPAALNARVLGLRDPQAGPDQALALAGRELARAAAYLVAWGEPRRAQAFLLRLDDVAPAPADRALAARLASGLGVPEVAVAIARRAGAGGVILSQIGWPQPPGLAFDAVEPALALGIMRQESSFDTETVSPAGARGLMQLMPATAAAVARQLGVAPSVPALVLDPRYNVRLGTTYLAGLLDQFGGAIPLAVAAYNAGPNRVQQWLGELGAPGPSVDMIDWIELIPFSETRNYVQRVIENQIVYRAQRGAVLPHPLAQWLR